jgi:hypothetical protein
VIAKPSILSGLASTSAPVPGGLWYQNRLQSPNQHSPRLKPTPTTGNPEGARLALSSFQSFHPSTRAGYVLSSRLSGSDEDRTRIVRSGLQFSGNCSHLFAAHASQPYLGAPHSRAHYPNPSGGRQDHAHHTSGIANPLHTCCLRFLFATNKLHARTVFRLT